MQPPHIPRGRLFTAIYIPRESLSLLGKLTLGPAFKTRPHSIYLSANIHIPRGRKKEKRKKKREKKRPEKRFKSKRKKKGQEGSDLEQGGPILQPLKGTSWPNPLPAPISCYNVYLTTNYRGITSFTHPRLLAPETGRICLWGLKGFLFASEDVILYLPVPTARWFRLYSRQCHSDYVPWYY